MSFLNLFRKKKAILASSSAAESETLNEDAKVIMGHALPDKTHLLFYRKYWAGKGDNEVQWIILKNIYNEIKITYKTAYAGYGETLPSLDNVNSKEITLPFLRVSNQDYASLIDTINRSFDIHISIEDCVEHTMFIRWLENNFTSEKVNLKEKKYALNNGYADRACYLVFKGKEYFYYFKETGNNKGYCMGNEVFEFNSAMFNKFKNGEFDRNTPMCFVMKLPAGDRDWLEDFELLTKLVHISIRREAL